MTSEEENEVNIRGSLRLTDEQKEDLLNTFETVSNFVVV